ncbi:MAG TPA: site-specific DNA-methyltransferase [Pyrinomonadaceae bacterium]|nr:site-specific DNA-methyltransferase [Pyrinomonadaceae bacterium]
MINFDGKSLDVRHQRLQQLREIFPEFFSEGKIDLNRISQSLADVSAEPDHYELSWAGKAEARKEIQKQTTATLIPDFAGSIKFDASDHIFIEGENLEVLRVLQKSYFGQIKMIYIDPPYNSGNDSFIYPDDYAERRQDYDKRTGIRDNEGYLNKLDLFKPNSRESGHYHSVWLSMMYPRLYLARNLLKKDGAIFVSVDDNEAANLKLLMDEVFGPENYVTTIYIKVRYEGKTLVEDSDFQKLIEQVLVYTRSPLFKPKKPIVKYDLEKFCFTVKTTGTAQVIELGNKRVEIFEAGTFSITEESPSRHGLKEIWASGKVLDGNSSGRFFRDHLAGRFDEDGYGALYKVYGIGDDGLGYRYFTGPKKKGATKGKYFQGIPSDIADDIQNQTKEVPIVTYFDFADSFGNCKHEGGIDFRNGKKPIRFIQQLFELVSFDDNDIVLDFFAGSASLAHAVLENNERQGATQLRFIAIQLPEPIDENSDAYKAGFRVISDIAKARLVNVINEKEKKQLTLDEKRTDLGFRAFRLFYSNFKKWQPQIGSAEELLAQLQIFQEPLETQSSDRYELLFELLVKAGLPLSADIDKRQSDDKLRFFVIDDGQLVFVLDQVSDSLMQDIEAIHPDNLVVLGNLFEGNNADELMTNWKLQLQDAGIGLTII